MFNTLKIILLLTVSLLYSCNEKSIFYEKNQPITAQKWNLSDTVKFTFSVTDTTTLYNFYLNLRVKANYEYGNFIAFYKLYFPNQKSLSDTAEFVLAKPNGKWLGKSVSGSIIENTMLFSKGRKFPLLGDYCFAVIHGMRNKPLYNVSDIGLKIMKSDEE